MQRPINKNRDSRAAVVRLHQNAALHNARAGKGLSPPLKLWRKRGLAPRLAFQLLFIIFATGLLTSEVSGQWIWSQKSEKPATSNEEKFYNVLTEGFDFYEKTRYDAAISKFKYASRKKRDNLYRETALFMTAMSLYMKKDYDGAFKYFEKVVKENPGSSYLNEIIQTEYNIALDFQTTRGSLTTRDRRLRAIRIYRGIIERAPFGKMQADAQLNMADTYLDLGNDFDAQHAYEAFIDLYKGDSRTGYAELKRAITMLRQSRGSNYDPVPFIEARETLGTLIQEEKDEKKRMEYEKLRDESIDALAQKDYEIGNYYYKIGQADSAIIYYKSSADNYPDAKWANLSKKRIDAISAIKSNGDKPEKKKMFFFSKKEKKEKSEKKAEKKRKFWLF